MLAWLNPANLWKLVSLVKAIWSAATSLYQWFKDRERKKAQDEAEKKLEADIQNGKRRDDEARKNEKDWLNS